jgi:hypothetical protein
MRFLIWSEEHGAWWLPGGAGYTTSIREAGRYMLEQALEIVVLANRGVEQPGFNEGFYGPGPRNSRVVRVVANSPQGCRA